MIYSLIDACELILELQGEPQNSDELASQIVETRLWRVSEQDVRAAIQNDIKNYGKLSQFVTMGTDEFALRAWTIK
jgi:DNA-directed RNA polymerase delta subunit